MPMIEATTRTTRAMMLRRRSPTVAASQPAGRSTASRASPYEPTISPAAAMLTPNSSRIAGRSGVRMFVAEISRKMEIANR
jgi:hypothetical protein